MKKKRTKIHFSFTLYFFSVFCYFQDFLRGFRIWFLYTFSSFMFEISKREDQGQGCLVSLTWTAEGYRWGEVFYEDNLESSLVIDLIEMCSIKSLLDCVLLQFFWIVEVRIFGDNRGSPCVLWILNDSMKSLAKFTWSRHWGFRSDSQAIQLVPFNLKFL